MFFKLNYFDELFSFPCCIYIFYILYIYTLFNSIYVRLVKCAKRNITGNEYITFAISFKRKTKISNNHTSIRMFDKVLRALQHIPNLEKAHDKDIHMQAICKGKNKFVISYLTDTSILKCASLDWSVGKRDRLGNLKMSKR